MTSKTYLLADGGYLSESHLTPIHYKSPNGVWEPIDCTLRPSAVGGFMYADETNVLKAYLPPTATGWIRLDVDDGTIAFRPLGALSVATEAIGSTLTAKEAWKDTAISYEAQPGRLKETLTLITASAPTTFNFEFTADGLTPRLNGDNTVSMRNGEGGIVCIIGTPWMCDLAGRTTTKASVTLTSTAEGFIYTLALDCDWLKDAVYPVTIDPSIVRYPLWTAVAQSNYPETTLTPGLIRQGQYQYDIVVGAPQYYGGYNTWRSVMQFDTTAIPFAADVTSASIQYNRHGTQRGVPPAVQLEAVGLPGTMGVTDVKWSNALVGGDPAPFAKSETHTFSPGATGYDGFSITPVVSDWADRRTPSNPAIPLNIMLRDQSDTGGGAGGYSYNEAYILADTVSAYTWYVTASRPVRAWYMNFNTPDRTAANATAMPALADIDLDGTVEAAVPMGTIDGANWADPYRGDNPNQMWVIKDLSGSGGYGSKLGWPRPARDGIRGVSLADFVPVTPNDDGHMEVLATNSQDEEGNDPDPNKRLFSHLYVWRDGGADVSPFAPYNLDSTYGKGFGHSYTAPVVWDVNGNGTPEVLFACLGQSNDNHQEFGGNIQGIEPTGPNLFKTSWVIDDPWYVRNGADEAEFQTPPVLTETEGIVGDVAATSLAGLIYAWHPSGAPVFSPVSLGLPVYNSLCAADVDGYGTGVLLVSTGNPNSYWFGGLNDGAVFCRNPNGSKRWTYPDPGYLPTMESGIAVGRIRGNDQPPCVVVADAAGTVYALDPVANDAGREFWTNSIPSTEHPYFNGVRAQPLIADVNGDGFQDVVIGTTNGEIFAFDGPTGGVLWQTHTFWTPDTVWNGVTEHHHEEVVGLAIGNLRADAPTNATILVTTGQAALTTPNPVGGHILILDCGPGTYDPYYADWAQYQRDAQRTGLFRP